MRSGFFTKDPSKLPCPRCGGQVDAGATWKAMRLAAKDALSCPHCSAPLRIASRSHFASIAVMLTIFTGSADLQRPWSWAAPALGLAISIYLIGKEQQSKHLVVREPFT